MESRPYLWLLVAGLGFAAGRFMPQLGPLGEDHAAGSSSVTPTSGKSRQAPAHVADARSTDTAASLLELSDPSDLYLRLALWLPQANAEDCAAFWETYSKRQPKPDEETAALLFSRWTELDPLAVIAATKGDYAIANLAWIAWARHDSRAALAAAREGDKKEFAYGVLAAIARSQPELALKLLGENADLNNQIMLGIIASALADQQPERAFALLADHNIPISDDMLGALARRDPHAALAWLQDHPGRTFRIRDEFIKNLREENPAMLAELAATAPPGALKRLLEGAAFQYLASKDPDKALEMARATEGPGIAQERFATVASGRLEAKDPQAALGILEEIYTKDPASRKMVRGAGIIQLLAELVKTDPAATMQVMARVDSNPSEEATSSSISRPFTQAALAWAKSDFPGFTSWVEAQPEGASRSRAARIVTQELLNQRRFAESIDWLGKTSGQLDPTTMDSIVGAWVKEDPQAARTWFGQANLPQDLAERLSRRFPSQP